MYNLEISTPGIVQSPVGQYSFSLASLLDDVKAIEKREYGYVHVLLYNIKIIIEKIESKDEY